MLKALSVAIRTAIPAERVYLIGLGENSLHFHCLLMPRTADTPQDWRGPQLLAHGKDLADPEQALLEVLPAAVRIDQLTAGERVPLPTWAAQGGGPWALYVGGLLGGWQPPTTELDV